jgi:carbonic anhydrase/acetyltransferase-like protein (isoleucine patch superfamily)
VQARLIVWAAGIARLTARATVTAQAIVTASTIVTISAVVTASTIVTAQATVTKGARCDFKALVTKRACRANKAIMFV